MTDKFPLPAVEGPPGAAQEPRLCQKQINTGTGSTNCRLEQGHGGYCSQHPIVMRPSLAQELTADDLRAAGIACDCQGNIHDRKQLEKQGGGIPTAEGEWHALGRKFIKAADRLRAARVLPVEPAQESGPIRLTAEQRDASKVWAADDRLWTTQETVEINLRTFARTILKLQPAVLPVEGTRAPQETKT